MPRIALVLGSLGANTDRLRLILSDSDTWELRFTTLEHWRDCVGAADLGAVVIADDVSPWLSDRIEQEVHRDWPDATVHVFRESPGSIDTQCRTQTEH